MVALPPFNHRPNGGGLVIRKVAGVLVKGLWIRLHGDEHYGQWTGPQLQNLQQTCMSIDLNRRFTGVRAVWPA
jgi:hypothetical protein